MFSILAVADGVGGWNNHGIDPSKYSKELVNK
jgi:serine/threonine protein phosphatase PrpC